MAPRCHSLSDNHIRLNSSCSTLSQGAPVSVKYRIDVSKDGKNITATFDVRVTDISSTELISDFHLNVDDQILFPNFNRVRHVSTALAPPCSRIPSRTPPSVSTFPRIRVSPRAIRTR